MVPCIIKSIRKKRPVLESSNLVREKFNGFSSPARAQGPARTQEGTIGAGCFAFLFYVYCICICICTLDLDTGPSIGAGCFAFLFPLYLCNLTNLFFLQFDFLFQQGSHPRQSVQEHNVHSDVYTR